MVMVSGERESGDLQNWYHNAFLRRRKAFAKERLIMWRIIAVEIYAN